MYPLLNDQQIRDIIGDKAERVIITGEESHKEIGIKVGMFAQTASISWKMNYNNQVYSIKEVLRDLIMMNKRDEWQHQQARKQAEREANG